MILLVDNNIYIYYGSYGSYCDNSNYRDIFVKITVLIFWAILPAYFHARVPETRIEMWYMFANLSMVWGPHMASSMMKISGFRLGHSDS